MDSVLSNSCLAVSSEARQLRSVTARGNLRPRPTAAGLSAATAHRPPIAFMSEIYSTLLSQRLRSASMQWLCAPHQPIACLLCGPFCYRYRPQSRTRCSLLCLTGAAITGRKIRDRLLGPSTDRAARRGDQAGRKIRPGPMMAEATAGICCQTLEPGHPALWHLALMAGFLAGRRTRLAAALVRIPQTANEQRAIPGRRKRMAFAGYFRSA